MSLHVFWPASTVLTLFVIGVILALLKYGPRFFKMRHDTLSNDREWDDKTYSRDVSVSIA